MERIGEERTPLRPLAAGGAHLLGMSGRRCGPGTDHQRPESPAP